MLSTYSCIHWLHLVCVLTRIEPATLDDQDDALTNWVLGQGSLANFEIFREIGEADIDTMMNNN